MKDKMTYVHTEMNEYKIITLSIAHEWYDNGYTIILCSNKPKITKDAQWFLDTKNIVVYKETTPEKVISILNALRKK